MFLDDDGKPKADRGDQCYTCTRFDSETELCPLIEALANRVVEMGCQDFAVKNCGLYQNRRRLKAL